MATIRDSVVYSSTGSTFTDSFPAAAQAGDTAFYFVGGSWNDSGAPSGWARLSDGTTGPNWNGSIYVKLLTSGDIATGTVTINMAGTGGVVRTIVVYQGAVSWRPVTSARNGSGSSPIALAASSAVQAGDSVLLFGSNGVSASTDTVDKGSIVRSTAVANASGVVNEYVPSTAGAFTANFSYSVPGVGNYQAIVPVRDAPPPTPGSHLYWRLYIVSQEGSNFNFMSLWSLDFQDSSGTSLCVGGTAIASSVYGSNVPSRIFPGGPGDWVSNNQMPCWVGYQFFSPVEPARIVLSNSNTGNNPIVMCLESSDDGVTWTREWILTKPPTWTLHSPVTYNAPAINATAAPYWGAFIETRDPAGGNYISLAELAFLDSGAARIPGFFNTVGCRTGAGNYDWSACWDGSLTTSVQAQTVAALPGQFVTAQYPAPVTVGGFSVTNITDPFYAQYIPESGGLYTSVDGLAWGLSYSFSPANATGYPPPGASATVTWIVAAPVTARRHQLINPI